MIYASVSTPVNKTTTILYITICTSKIQNYDFILVIGLTLCGGASATPPLNVIP